MRVAGAVPHDAPSRWPKDWLATMFAFAFGVGSAVISLLTFLYAIGFVANWIVARTIDGYARGSGPGAWLENAFLLGLFAAQHSLMARPDFKRLWRRLLPPAIERSAYVLASSLVLMLLFLRWNPILVEVWDAGANPLGLALELLSFAGWGLVVAGACQLDPLEFVGLRQVIGHVRGDELEPTPFEAPFLYRWVRHPMHLGLLTAFWCTPRMTLGHLLFAALMTGYVLYAVRLEERDLAGAHPEYRMYQRRVPRLWPNRAPLPPRRSTAQGSTAQAPAPPRRRAS